MDYKAVVVGCGGRASAHIEAYQYIPEAQVVACCAPSSRRRDPLGARFGLRTYADAAEMIRREKPDIVHLVTWPDTRVALMTLVSEMGVPLCTVEKPIATGVADWRKLEQLERESATKFAVCHQFRWQPDLMRCQQAMESLGAARVVHLSAGMDISGQGTHTLNYGRSLIGDPLVTRVFGTASGWDADDPGHPAPAATVAQLEFDSGCRGFWTSGIVSPRCGDSGTTWQHVRVAAYAERGRVTYEEFGRWEIIAPDLEERGTFGSMDGWMRNNLQAQAFFHQAMFRWIEDGTPPGTNLQASLHEWAVVLALYQSALERRPIEMAGFNPPEDLVDQLRRTLG